MVSDSAPAPPSTGETPAACPWQRFVPLLAALTLLLLAAPVVRLLGTGTHPRLAQIVLNVTFVIMLLSALFAISRSRLTTIVAVLLAAPAIVLQLLNLFIEGDSIELAKGISGIAALSYTVIVILVFLFATDRASVATICAAVCIYLLLGVLWALVYSVLELLAPASFTIVLAGDAEGGAMRFRAEEAIFPLYYSFVTLTTLGYGDVVPSSPPARMFAALEAIMGQLYLAVLVARLVGLHISQSTLAREPASESAACRPGP
jgi:hypothetical protein